MTELLSEDIEEADETVCSRVDDESRRRLESSEMRTVLFFFLFSAIAPLALALEFERACERKKEVTLCGIFIDPLPLG
jgi:hypothetical protein